MKRIFLISLVLLFFGKFCYSQDTILNRAASFRNYGQYINLYLNSQHESKYKGELDSIRKQFFFIVSFKIDETGNVVDYESDIKEDIPKVVVNYIKKVIYFTSGNWQPEIKDCRIIKSSKIRCKVSVWSKDFFLNKLKSDKDLILENFKLINEPELNFDEPNTCFLQISY